MACQHDYKHLRVIIECKQPDENSGLNQLEIYLSNEPHAKLGVWANHPERAAKSIFVYRMPEGLVPKSATVSDLPGAGDAIAPSIVKTTFDDLVEPNADILRARFLDLLDRVVARDSNVTRREDQLDQLCDLVLQGRRSRLARQQVVREPAAERGLGRVVEANDRKVAKDGTAMPATAGARDLGSHASASDEPPKPGYHQAGEGEFDRVADQVRSEAPRQRLVPGRGVGRRFEQPIDNQVVQPC